MPRRRTETNAGPLFRIAALIYAANCALGTAVATRLVDTRRFRWVHHALYIATCTAVAVAVSARWWSRRPADARAALSLAPAAVPLIVIARVPTHGRRHPLVALAAAPFIIAGVVRSHRPSDRK